MKRVVDKTELRVYWQLSNWGEKTIYVIGWVFTVLIAASFILGFAKGL